MSTEIKNKNITENKYTFTHLLHSNHQPSAFYKDGKKLKRKEYIDTRHIDIEFRTYFPEYGYINLFKLASRSLNDECEFNNNDDADEYYECNVFEPCEKCENNLKKFVPTLNHMTSIDSEPGFAHQTPRREVKLHLAEEKQRSLTYEDYAAHTTRLRMFLDPKTFNRQVELSFYEMSNYNNLKEEYYICGIPINQGRLVYGNFCSSVYLDKETNTYHIDGEGA